MNVSRINSAGSVLGLAFLCAGAIVQAAEPDVSFSTGLEYSSGGYGGTEDIEELYVPVSGVFYFDRIAVGITVPYLSVRAPLGTVDPGGEPVPGSGDIDTQSGLGDVLIGMTVYDVLRDYDRGIALDITGKIKLGSADPDKGLGTGEEDYLLRADLYKFFDRFTLMGSGGYKVRGDPAGVDLMNTWLGSVGGSYLVNDGVRLGLVYDYRESSLQDGDDISELTLYSSLRLSDTWDLQFFAFSGFSDSSPDWGAGIYVYIN
jgi:hypothetical protein